MIVLQILTVRVTDKTCSFLTSFFVSFFVRPGFWIFVNMHFGTCPNAPTIIGINMKL